LDLATANQTTPFVDRIGPLVETPSGSVVAACVAMPVPWNAEYVGDEIESVCNATALAARQREIVIVMNVIVNVRAIAIEITLRRAVKGLKVSSEFPRQDCWGADKSTHFLGDLRQDSQSCVSPASSRRVLSYSYRFG
jgi:hypothetical protein